MGLFMGFTLWFHQTWLENPRTHEWNGGFFIGTSPMNDPFSIAMFDYRSVNVWFWNRCSSSIEARSKHVSHWPKSNILHPAGLFRCSSSTSFRCHLVQKKQRFPKTSQTTIQGGNTQLVQKRTWRLNNVNPGLISLGCLFGGYHFISLYYYCLEEPPQFINQGLHKSRVDITIW